jgi:hypothetical protein
VVRICGSHSLPLPESFESVQEQIQRELELIVASLTYGAIGQQSGAIFRGGGREGIYVGSVY